MFAFWRMCILYNSGYSIEHCGTPKVVALADYITFVYS